MSYFDYADHLERIKYLAEHRQAGNATQLAKRLSVSQRTVQRMIQQLRDHGFPIIYNRYRKVYELEKTDDLK